MELEGPCNNDLVSLIGPGISLDSLGCVVLSPSEYLHRIQLWSSPWGLTPGSEPSQQTAFTTVGVQTPSWLGVMVNSDHCGEFSICLPSIYCVIPQSSPASPPVRGFQVCRSFSSFTAPSLRCRTCLVFFSLSLSFFPLSAISLLLYVEISMSFWKPEVFCQHSIDDL